MTTPTSITGQTGIAAGLSHAQTPANLAKAGQQFEAVFDGMMLKAMRQTKLADPLFDSQALDTFTDMQDQQVAQSMAQHQPIGIGKALTAFLARSAQPNAGAATTASKGAVNESMSGPPA